MINKLLKNCQRVNRRMKINARIRKTRKEWTKKNLIKENENMKENDNDFIKKNIKRVKY